MERKKLIKFGIDWAAILALALCFIAFTAIKGSAFMSQSNMVNILRAMAITTVFGIAATITMAPDALPKNLNSPPYRRHTSQYHKNKYMVPFRLQIFPVTLKSPIPACFCLWKASYPLRFLFRYLPALYKSNVPYHPLGITAFMLSLSQSIDVAFNKVYSTISFSSI